MQFLPKWAQNVSKFILFHFQIRYQFSIFYQFLYFWNVFADISQQQNAQTCKTVTNVTQKREVVWPWKLAWMLSIYRATKPWRLMFDIYFQLWITMQSFLIGRLPVGFMVLCAMYSYIIFPSMVNMRHFVFELRLLQFSQ